MASINISYAEASEGLMCGELISTNNDKKGCICEESQF